ncbi:hypothetical protein MLD38_025902 [Melastoma candidum]|nr:hypothetical protein MLD38_025902 [Melastoma candidum]
MMMAAGCFASFVLGFRNYSTKYAGSSWKWKNFRVIPRSSRPGSTPGPRGRTSSPKVVWSEDQLRITDAVSAGKSVFISGPAGTGKTRLVQHLIKLLRKMWGQSNVYITASTGVASCTIKGQTLHSFAGLKDVAADWDSLLSGVTRDKRAVYRWKKAKVVVLDEISMIDGELFENLERVARELRKIDKPWGGIQLVVAGDFFQLPPVSKGKDKGFAFQAKCWNTSFDLQVELTRVFRQSDETLIRVLQSVRKGGVKDEDLELLEQSCCNSEPDSSVVRLFPRNNQVNAVNQQRIEELGNDCYQFSAADSGEESWKKQLEKMIAPNEIALCEGARVMLIKNMSTWKGLVNGAVGTIVGFIDSVDVADVCPDGVLPIVKFDSGKKLVIPLETWCVMDGDKVVAHRKQIPLLLAWALSIHKCQGMTLDRLHTDLSEAFGYGMVYVALSRIRNMSGLNLSGFDRTKIKAHPKVLEFYANLANRQHEESKTIGETVQDRDNGSKPKDLPSGESDMVTKNLRFSLSEFLRSTGR